MPCIKLVGNILIVHHVYAYIRNTVYRLGVSLLMINLLTDIFFLHVSNGFIGIIYNLVFCQHFQVISASNLPLTNLDFCLTHLLSKFTS